MPPTQPEQRAAVAGMARPKAARCRGQGPVSYYHLTLPTNRGVERWWVGLT